MFYYQEETPEYEEGKEYTNRQMELIADAMLREDAKSEICKDCKERGDETGKVESRIQGGVTDGEGNQLSLDFPEYACKNGHTWFKGEGLARGIGGDDPIL